MKISPFQVIEALISCNAEVQSYMRSVPGLIHGREKEKVFH